MAVYPLIFLVYAVMKENYLSKNAPSKKLSKRQQVHSLSFFCRILC